MNRTTTILFNLSAVTLLLVVSGIAICFQVAHGETIDPVMAMLWLSIWLVSLFIGLEVIKDCRQNELDEFEEWLEAQMPPLFAEAYV